MGVGLLALALVQPWGRVIPRRLLLVKVWTVGGGMLLYGAASLLQHGLMVAGAIGTPEALGPATARWHLYLWDP